MWCRRGDSNPHELPHTPLKRARLPVPPLRQYLSDSYYSEHRPHTESQTEVCAPSVQSRCYFGLAFGFFDVAFEFCGLVAGEAFAAGDAEVAGAVEAAGEAVSGGDVTGSGPADCNTECEPVTAGKDNINAINIKAAAAPIVILERMLAVPRGPNAVLETLLEKSAPASALPGCNRITMTSTTQARINNTYRR
jgi:hypothetical protein